MKRNMMLAMKLNYIANCLVEIFIALIIFAVLFGINFFGVTVAEFIVLWLFGKTTTLFISVCIALANTLLCILAFFARKDDKNVHE